MAALPPPPTTDQMGSYAWLEWFRQLRTYIANVGSVPWSIIDFAGSTLSSIASRSHQVLQSLQGGIIGQYYHLTQQKYNEVNQNLDLSGSSGTGVKVDLTTPTFGWRDIIGAVEPKASGVGSPTRASYSGGNLGAYSFAANDVCDFVFHIPHDYIPGTDLYFHIHWSHTGTTISGSAVFDIYHDYAKGHNQANYPAEKNITITYPTVDITTTPRYRHRIDEVIISGASATATLMDRNDIEVDGVVRVTLKMTTLPTLGGAGKLFIDTCDIHYQSTNLATKNKVPNFYV